MPTMSAQREFTNTVSPAEVRAEDADGRDLGDRAVAFLAVAQRALGDDLLGDVLGHADEPAEVRRPHRATPSTSSGR